MRGGSCRSESAGGNLREIQFLALRLLSQLPHRAQVRLKRLAEERNQRSTTISEMAHDVDEALLCPSFVSCDER